MILYMAKPRTLPPPPSRRTADRIAEAATATARGVPPSIVEDVIAGVAIAIAQSPLIADRIAEAAAARGASRDYHPAPRAPFPDAATIRSLQLGPERPGPETIAELARRVGNVFARAELQELAKIVENDRWEQAPHQIAEGLARVMYAIGVWRFTCYENVPGYEAITTPTKEG